MKLNDIINNLEQFAPLNLAEDWDNVGLLVGDRNQEVKKVLLALDVTTEVVDEAINTGANLIVAHHPIIFKAIKNVVNGNAIGDKLIKLIKNDIAVYVMHTNFDSADGGTNDVVFDLLNLENREVLEPIEGYENCGLGRVGTLPKKMLVNELLQFLKDTNKFDYINYSLDFEGMNKEVKKVGLCTGSVMTSLIIKSKKLDCDVYITGDLTYHTAQMAKDIGITIIDIGHYCSENIVFENLKQKLDNDFENIEFIISKINAQTISTF